MKLSTAIKRFDTQLMADGKSERTRQAYLRDLRKLEAWLNRDVDASTLIPDTLARYIKAVRRIPNLARSELWRDQSGVDKSVPVSHRDISSRASPGSRMGKILRRRDSMA